MVDWKKRGFKILASFFNGYGGGWTVGLPANVVLAPSEIQWGWLFILPILSGLTMTWPQLAKVFNEVANS